MKITELLKQWFSGADIAKLNIAIRTEGGWEGWFQMEFASFLTENNIPYTREYPYKSGRADIMMQTGEDQELICEIKCYSLLSGSDFTSLVHADLEKLRTCGCNGFMICLLPVNTQDVDDTTVAYSSLLSDEPELEECARLKLDKDFEFVCLGGYTRLS